MMRAILDEVVPHDFVQFFAESDIDVTAFPDVWRSASDGDLISQAIAADFDWLITCDKQMPFQQNLKGKTLSIMVLPTPKILELRLILPALIAVLHQPAPGHFVILDATGTPAMKPTPLAIGPTSMSN